MSTFDLRECIPVQMRSSKRTAGEFSFYPVTVFEHEEIYEVM
ncbi:MAG: hypothetical protein ACMXYD_05700 [Candidatus Woesearchaeota archaeon]